MSILSSSASTGSSEGFSRRDGFDFVETRSDDSNKDDRDKADGGASLVFGDRLGQNQFCAQAKSSWQPGAAIDDGDRDRVVAVFSATANVKDQLGGGQIFTIDQHQVEALRIKFLGSGYSVQRTLASH